MINLPLIPNLSSQDDDTPLPRIVAKRWNFPLAHTQTQNGMYYAVQDWMRGLTGEQKPAMLWSKFKKTDAGRQLLNSILSMSPRLLGGKRKKPANC